MSWQSYIDDQLLATKAVKNAVICGHDGNIWAKSGDFAVNIEFHPSCIFISSNHVENSTDCMLV